MKALMEWLLILIGKNAAMLITLAVTSTMRVIIDNKNKRLTAWQKVGKFFIAFACGFLISRYFSTHGMQSTADWAGPVATLSGEGAIVWFTGHADKIYAWGLKKITGMKDNDLDGNNTTKTN